MSDTKEGGVIDSIMKGIGEAVTDIRHKVVEEGMWGRQVTPDVQPEVSPYAAEGMPATFGELRASKDVADKRNSNLVISPAGKGRNKLGICMVSRITYGCLD